MRVLLITLFFLKSLCALAQKNNNSKAQNLIGIQARLIDLMPFEISYFKLAPKGISFALRGGYGIGQKNETTTELNNYIPSKQKNYYINYGRDFTLTQTFEAIFIKPGIVVLKSKSSYFTNCLLLNYSIAKSYDKLTINSQDQLYGNVQLTDFEEHLYQSIEIEGNHQLMLGQKISLGMGYLIGYKLQNEIAFENKIYGIEKNSQYSPSQGVGTKFYINLTTALLYKF